MTELRYIEGSLVGEKYKHGFEFNFSVAIPCVNVKSFALVIEHDGDMDRTATVNSMLRLADEGKSPYCVTIAVAPGHLLLPDGEKRNMRMNCYDLFDREYGDFLIYELIPYIEKTYNLKFSKSPDMHMVSGGSSGGISAFVIAWFHPDYFHRVYMSSPSFLAMGRGNEIPYLIRKYETKPLRIYEELSEHEPNDYFGWSRAVAEDAREALTFANYDFKCEYFPGEWHCSHYKNEEQAYKRNQWLWQGWDKTEVVAPDNSPRVNKVIPKDSEWVPCEEFPFLESSASQGFPPKYETAVLSNDGALWYCGNTNDDIIYSHIVNNQNSAIIHATLHTIPRQAIKGPIDMAVDKTDRLFVLTEIGIQCVRSFGLIDVILRLPDNTTPQKIAITDALYIQTQMGVYKRTLCEDCVIEREEKRKQISYYD